MWNTNNSNRICSERELIKNHQMHMKHMQTVKSQLQLRPPTAPLRSPGSTITGPHQNKFEKTRKKQIMYENHLLLKKIMSIDLQKGTLAPIPAKKTLKSSTVGSMRSLHYWKKKKENMQISQGNAMILKKLSNAQSVYSTQRWKQDFNKHKTLCEMLSRSSARSMRNKYFFSPKGGEVALDKGTASLIRNILTRRSKRVKDSSKPQTANPDLANPREEAFNGLRPNTSPYGAGLNAYKAVEEHFPLPEGGQGDPQLEAKPAI